MECGGIGFGWNGMISKFGKRGCEFFYVASFCNVAIFSFFLRWVHHVYFNNMYYCCFYSRLHVA